MNDRVTPNPDTFPEPSTLEVLISAHNLRKRITQIAEAISHDYANEVVWLVGVLKGAFMLTSDLARSLTIPCQIHFVQASSYGSEKVSSGQVQLANTLDVVGQHVVLIEDIYDTGNTLKHVLRDLQQQNPASLEVCTLLDKQIPDKCPIEVKYLGFEIPKRFVVGYGLDYAERYRELPYIACLD